MFIFILLSILASKIYKNLQDAINSIDWDGWITLKKRYIFAQKHAVNSLNIRENQDSRNALLSGIESIFCEEDVLSDLAKKYTEKNDSDVISEIEDEASKIPDKEFVKNICIQGILNKFYETYKEWRTRIVPSKIAQIICDHIEGLYPFGKLLHIIDVEGKVNVYSDI